MTGCRIQRFDLFKAAMGNSGYLTEICKNTTNQATFFASLEEGHLTFSEILESIQIVQNQQVKSLLIIYLLSQEEYLTNLNGDSLLNRLTDRENHTPSRLNALIHQLDLKILTPTLIGKLQPEAAVSILCSIPHFHLLTKMQTEALIKKYPQHELIVYWMNHFSSMPNAHYVLAHLMKIAGSNILQELSKIESSHKEGIITNIIEHLELFNFIPSKFLHHANKESYLNLAIRLYLNGHYNKAYVTYINQLTKKLLDTNHIFSLPSIRLLFLLNDKLAFKELAIRTAHLTNSYLRNNAQEGSIELFYQNDQINTQRMLQEINLNPIVSDTTKESYQNQEEHGETNSFKENLFKNYKLTNYFEYFLIYYEGTYEPICKLLNDYIKFYGPLRNGSQIIHHLALMLTCPKLSTTIKEAIFTTFLKYPALFDEDLCKHLFLFDAKRTILYFGLRGGEKNYQYVIDFCKFALKNLNPKEHSEIIQITQKALTEAQFELNFSKKKGAVFKFFNRLKRCWMYGWSGFFKPNSPEHVISESSFKKRKQPIFQKINKSPTFQTEEIDLPTLLDAIEPPLTIEKFDMLIKALNLYSIQSMPKEELSTRQKLQELYHQVVTKKENNPLSRWLKENQSPFVMNQFRLLELLLKEKGPKEVDLFLSQIHEDSDHLLHVFEEFNCTMPEWIAKNSSKPKSPETTDFIASTTKVLSECAATATECAQNTWGWAGGVAKSFFLKIKKQPQDDEEEGFVEHIDSFFTRQ